MTNINIDLAQRIYKGDTDEERELLKTLRGYKLELTEKDLKVINLPVKEQYNRHESHVILGLSSFKQSVSIMFLKNFSVIDEDLEIIKIKDRYYFSSNVFCKKASALTCLLIIANSSRHALVLENILYISDIMVEIINNKSVDQLVNDFKSVDSNTINCKPTELIPNSKTNYKTYLMINKDGHIKIGRSKNPKARESTLQSQQPSIKMYAISDCNIESILHKKYSEFRLRGEWFNLSDNHLLDIISEFGFKRIE